MTDRQTEWLASAREMLDWLEQHPEYIPDYDELRLNQFVYSKEELAAAARVFGKAEKDIVGGFYLVRKSFGPHRIDVNAPREKVCKKVITGTVEHEERVVPAHTEEIVEWVCDEPLLAPSSHSVRAEPSLMESLAIADQHDLQREMKW